MGIQFIFDFVEKTNNPNISSCLPKPQEKPKSPERPPRRPEDHQVVMARSAPRNAKSYAIYIYKFLKQVHPDTGVSLKAMSIMNSFVSDIFNRIADEASKLAKYNK